ncbi:F-type H+-transporting ATPase subunit c [Anaeroplasma bactoclasticum]|jgi:F-type H+-transporting ATPase subunit c|uniref:ATP synthase subunit c n=1 Tax=Anaeroplasma bactoclasticum TaxID=2088 RepID=A0A397S520_9MOLU|nr:ATP synthase F0 subunit C [Anaeroplasma bactoclasticum]RIA77811.1 F-type H+-transporting ATPase subunit c [Anaeroplasma bactoclasticum]
MNFMTIFNTVLTFLAEMSVGDGLRYIGAGLAVFTGFAAAIGEGNVAAHAVDAMARQPEMAGNIRTTMLIGQAVSETTGLYGLIIAILIVFAA